MKKGKNIQEAADIINRGGLVAFPTETVYGLGADVFNPKAVTRIFEVKKRPSFDPLIVHIANYSQLEILCERVTESVLELAHKFWPGPLTIVLPKKSTVPDIVTSGLSTVAVRMPSHPIAIELINKSGTPIAAPSANRFGYLSPTLPQHVEKQLHDIDYLIDGGACQVGIESTVISLCNDSFKILRPGAITANEISLVKPYFSSEHEKDIEIELQSPGLIKSHYSPNKPLYIIRKIETFPDNSGLIAFKRPQRMVNAAKIEVLSEEGKLDEAAINLFSALHRMEESDIDAIYVEAVPETGIGIAIMDRLNKAAYKFSNTTVNKNDKVF